MISSAEISRKLIHLFNLIIPLGYVYIIPDKQHMTMTMIVIAGLFVIVDLARMRVAIVKKIFHKLFNFMMRDHEISGRLTGATWVVIISVPIIYFLPMEIAVLSMVYMSVGDITAAIIGQSFGKTKIGNKSLEGSIGCFTACVAAAVIIDFVPIIVSISGAFMATVSEALSIDIDDNVLIPIGAGTTMAIVSSFIV